jgi:hypothetical protein
VRELTMKEMTEVGGGMPQAPVSARSQPGSQRFPQSPVQLPATQHAHPVGATLGCATLAGGAALMALPLIEFGGPAIAFDVTQMACHLAFRN